MTKKEAQKKPEKEKEKMKTVHLTVAHHELLYNLKTPDQSYDDIVGNLIEEKIARLETEYKEKHNESEING
jgi:hypothetical protein